jgi:predicted dehydrogenase
MVQVVQNGKQGVAVFGGGHWGPHLIRNFSDHPQSQVVYVVEPRQERRAALAERFPHVQMTGEGERVFADEAVSAVVVATPTSTHFELVRAALEAGKHVFVEKPITDSVGDARKLCELAKTRELVLMVGHVFLFNPAVVEARRLIEAGELGEVYYASMLRTNLGPVRTDVDAGWDLASHDISIANFWLNSSPVAVSCRGGSWLNKGIDDTVFATFDYPGGKLVHIHASWLHPRKSRFMVVVGSRRMLSVNDMDLTEPLRIYDKGVENSPNIVHDTFASFRANIRDGSITIPNVSLGEPLRAECNEFISRVAGAEGRISDGWSGLEVVKALAAMSLSSQRNGTCIGLDEIE